jgi:hypothetical protein
MQFVNRLTCKKYEQYKHLEFFLIKINFLKSHGCLKTLKKIFNNIKFRIKYIKFVWNGIYKRMIKIVKSFVVYH